MNNVQRFVDMFYSQFGRTDNFDADCIKHDYIYIYATNLRL